MLSACFLAGEIVALKKLKMEREKEGFPITSLREIDTLLNADHPNIVHVRVSCVRAIGLGEEWRGRRRRRRRGDLVVGSKIDDLFIPLPRRLWLGTIWTRST